MSFAQGDFRLRFLAATETSKFEIVTDRSGMSIRERGRSERYVAWKDVERVTPSPPSQNLDLHLRGCDETITIPFDVSGDDGGFEELLSVILESADLRPLNGEIPAKFGQFNTRSIVAWLFVGAVGATAAVVMTSDRGHWIVGAMIAAMWLFTVWYGGLSKEVTLTVNPSGFALRKLLSRREYFCSELSNVSLRLVPAGRGQHLLGLIISVRAGTSEELTRLGTETIEAFLSLRSVLRGDD